MIKRRLRSLLAVAASCLFGLTTQPTSAGGLDDLVQIEVLDGGLTKRGTHQAALRLTLADGWKTYWRVPGEAGIPPQIGWGRSRNVKAVSLSWPTPQVFDVSGLRSIGYKHQLVLPVEIGRASCRERV